MNHFLQAEMREDSGGDIGRYGDTATEYIVRALMRRDGDASHYRGQIFGGAAVFKTASADVYHVGQKNVEIARAVLKANRIRVIREEIGGTRGRRVRFDTASNEVFCRFAGQVGGKYRE